MGCSVVPVPIRWSGIQPPPERKDHRGPHATRATDVAAILYTVLASAKPASGTGPAFGGLVGDASASSPVGARLRTPSDHSRLRAAPTGGGDALDDSMPRP